MIHTLKNLDCFGIGPMPSSSRKTIITYSLISTANNLNLSSLVLNKVKTKQSLKFCIQNIGLHGHNGLICSSELCFQAPRSSKSSYLLGIRKTQQPVGSTWYHTKIWLFFFFCLWVPPLKCTHGCHKCIISSRPVPF